MKRSTIQQDICVYLNWLFWNALLERETGCVVAEQQRAVLSSTVQLWWHLVRWSLLHHVLNHRLCSPQVNTQTALACRCMGAKVQHSSKLGQMKTYRGIALMDCFCCCCCYFCFRWFHVKHFETSFYAFYWKQLSETFSTHSLHFFRGWSITFTWQNESNNLFASWKLYSTTSKPTGAFRSFLELRSFLICNFIERQRFSLFNSINEGHCIIH